MPESPNAVLDKLLNIGAEGEVIEFKSRKNLSDKEMGQYFSALSNEANLRDIDTAWMVFGVDDKTHAIVSSPYKDSPESINSLKHYISENCTDRLTYRNVYELNVGGKRVLMFEIPAAKRGLPTAFLNQYYGRNGESLVTLSTEKYERIVRQTRPDWSAGVIRDASMDDLDPMAISRAREGFKKRNPNMADESDSWTDETFLNKVHILVEGKVTVTALILLGKEDSCHKVPGVNLSIRWMVRDSDNDVKEGRVYGTPFIISAEEICSRIRNPSYEFLRRGSLVPDRMDTYDPYVIREALNNCIAHQDYSKCEFITVVERPYDRLIFSNAGRFIPETVEAVIENDRPANYYRNPFLMKAMTNIGMVDTMGSGIIHMYKSQKTRMFPLPEYDLSNDEVELTIYGHVMDERFVEALLNMPSMSLLDAIALDKVQKGKELTRGELDSLRNKGLIELVGSHPVISSIVASKVDTETKAQTVLNRGFDNDYYRDLIIRFIMDYGYASRMDINVLIGNKLPDVLSDRQKYDRISYLIKSLHNSGRIAAKGNGRNRRYILVSEPGEVEGITRT